MSPQLPPEAATLHLDGYRTRLRFGVRHGLAKARVDVILVLNGVEEFRETAWAAEVPEDEADALKARAGDVRALLMEMCRLLTIGGPWAREDFSKILAALGALPSVRPTCDHVRTVRFKQTAVGHIWRAPDGAEYFAVENGYVRRLNETGQAEEGAAASLEV